MARRRFFVPALDGGVARLTGEDAEHLTRVLRVERGQFFEISDNERVYLAEVTMARKAEVIFEVREELPQVPEIGDTTLLVALIKFDRLEWILEKSTELGVTRIQLVRAERSEKGLEVAAVKRMARWQRILQESSQQSRRQRMPELGEVMPLAQAMKTQFEYRLWLDEEATDPILPALRGLQQNSRVGLLLGPEGGWAPREREAIRGAGWTAVSLGPLVLRAETAATAALAVIRARSYEDATNVESVTKNLK